MADRRAAGRVWWAARTCGRSCGTCRPPGLPAPVIRCAHVLATTDLGEEQVRTALAYHAAYPEEVDARIAEEAELVERLLAGVS